VLSSISVSNMLCWTSHGYHLRVGMEDDSRGSFETLQGAAVADKMAAQSVLTET